MRGFVVSALVVVLSEVGWEGGGNYFDIPKVCQQVCYFIFKRNKTKKQAHLW